MAVLFALALLLSQTPQHRLFMQPNLPTSNLPLFSAFGTNGLGTTTACSTTPPTGAKGEALSCPRTGNATCSKQGPAATGILPGDLVVMTDSQPRMSLVGSLLMYLRESASTNKMLRSEAFENAAYTSDFDSAPRTPTITADFGLAPDGATTADRFQSVATTGAQYSARFQAWVAGAIADPTTCSIFVQSNGSTDTTDLCLFDGAAWTCAACAFTAGTYGRCVITDLVGASSTTRFCKFGNNGLQNGGVARNAADLLVWGLQGENLAWASSYSPTAAAASTRNADSVCSATMAGGIGPRFSLGASFQMVSDSAGASTAAQLGTAATDLAQVGRSTSTAASFLINATNTTPAVAAMGVTLHRGSLNDASGTRTAWWDGASVSAPAASMVGATTAISFGAVDAYTARVVADPTPGRAD